METETCLPHSHWPAALSSPKLPQASPHPFQLSAPPQPMPCPLLALDNGDLCWFTDLAASYDEGDQSLSLTLSQLLTMPSVYSLSGATSGCIIFTRQWGCHLVTLYLRLKSLKQTSAVIANYLSIATLARPCLSHSPHSNRGFSLVTGCFCILLATRNQIPPLIYSHWLAAPSIYSLQTWSRGESSNCCLLLTLLLPLLIWLALEFAHLLSDSPSMGLLPNLNPGPC